MAEPGGDVIAAVTPLLLAAASSPDVTASVPEHDHEHDFRRMRWLRASASVRPFTPP